MIETIIRRPNVGESRDGVEATPRVPNALRTHERDAYAPTRPNRGEGGRGVTPSRGDQTPRPHEEKKAYGMGGS